MRGLPTEKRKESMKAGLFAVSLVAAAMAAGAAETNEQEKAESGGGFSAEVSVDFMSDYIWRGVMCNGNPVWQPSVTLAYKAGDFGKVAFNAWGTFDLTHKRGTSGTSRHLCGAQEIDYTLSYANSVGPVGVEVGHIWYTFHNNDAHSTQELYGSLSYENPIVTPSATVFWDYTDSGGIDASAVYCSFALSHDFKPIDALTVTPKAELGLADHAYTNSKGGTELTDQTVGVAVKYAFTKWLSVGAEINYTWTPSHTLRHEGYMGDGRHQIVWGGVNLTIAF